MRGGKRQRAPPLEPGITRLRVARRVTGVHRLVADALRTATGPAYWVDAGNEAAPASLYAAADDRLALERLRVARAFTAYQHRSLVAELADRVTPRTALVVVSAMPALYGDEDLLPGEGARLFRAGVKTLLRLRRRVDCPIVVSHRPDRADAMTDLLAACTDRELSCVETPHGPRFEGPGVETAGYADALGEQATLDAFEVPDAVPVDAHRPDVPVEV